MQVRAGEDEDTAWKRMRGKLGTGKHLDETYVLLPQAVPHAEGVVVAPPVVVGPTGVPVGQLPLGGQPPVGGGDGSGTTAENGQPPVSVGPGGGSFGGQSTVRQLSTAGATSALNLLGKVESWGITTGTQVQDVQLKVANLTGAQLNELLKKLPDGITYELTLNKEEK